MTERYDPRTDYEYAQASKRWATLAILIVSVGIVAGIWWFTLTYYGEDGVRVLGIVLAILALIGVVIGIGFAINAITAGLFMRMFLGILNGLVRHEEADDRGEIARSLVGVAKVSKQMERDVLRGSIQLGRQQAAAIIQAQRGQDRQQVADQQRAWFDAPARFDVDADGDADGDAPRGYIPKGW